MSATVHSFSRLYREHRLPCPCKDGRTCATHMCMDLADYLREELDRGEGELLLPAERHTQFLEFVIDVLDTVTGERARMRGNPNNHNPTQGVR